MTSSDTAAAPPTRAPLEPMPEDWQRALAVVAHPDDVECGAAAAVAAWTVAGREVAYLLATRGEAGIDTLEPAWAGVRWVAVTGSPHPPHAVDVTGTLERGIASLTEHRTSLAALGDAPPEQQAREFYDSTTAATAARFGGRRAVAFELALGGAS